MSEEAEFRGATKVEITHLQKALAEVRGDLSGIRESLGALESFRSRVLALAGAGAGIATILVQFLLDKFGGG